MPDALTVNREHRDTVFRMLYKGKKELLTLYNALNGTDYQDPEELTVTTLENAIYFGMKNDVSFLLDSRLMLYEHQSTWNPNIPLRDLLYIARLLEKYVNERGKSLYSSALVRLPESRFVVFYNGLRIIHVHADQGSVMAYGKLHILGLLMSCRRRKLPKDIGFIRIQLFCDIDAFLRGSEDHLISLGEYCRSFLVRFGVVQVGEEQGFDDFITVFVVDTERVEIIVAVVLDDLGQVGEHTVVRVVEAEVGP